MNIYELKYRTALDIAKIVFPEVPEAIFCGGTALNTFYLDYRYSEDLDVGYSSKNPKTKIEEILKKNGYVVHKTITKTRDLILVEGTEIKMDIFEYIPIIGTKNEDLQGKTIKTLPPEEFALSKTVSFMTREEKNGIVRDAYDLFKLCEIVDVPILIKKHKKEILKRVDVVKYNFNIFYESEENAKTAIGPLLKEDVRYEQVKEFIKKTEALLL